MKRTALRLLWVVLLGRRRHWKPDYGARNAVRILWALRIHILLLAFLGIAGEVSAQTGGYMVSRPGYLAYMRLTRTGSTLYGSLTQVYADSFSEAGYSKMRAELAGTIIDGSVTLIQGQGTRQFDGEYRDGRFYLSHSRADGTLAVLTFRRVTTQQWDAALADFRRQFGHEPIDRYTDEPADRFSNEPVEHRVIIPVERRIPAPIKRHMREPDISDADISDADISDTVEPSEWHSYKPAKRHTVVPTNHHTRRYPIRHPVVSRRDQLMRELAQAERSIHAEAPQCRKWARKLATARAATRKAQQRYEATRHRSGYTSADRDNQHDRPRLTVRHRPDDSTSTGAQKRSQLHGLLTAKRAEVSVHEVYHRHVAAFSRSLALAARIRRELKRLGSR